MFTLVKNRFVDNTLDTAMDPSGPNLFLAKSTCVMEGLVEMTLQKKGRDIKGGRRKGFPNSNGTESESVKSSKFYWNKKQDCQYERQ